MRRVILVGFVVVGLTQSSHATNLLWSPTNAVWDVGATFNWNSQTAAFAQGDDVLFDDTGLAYSTVDVGANLLSPASVVVDSSSQYIIGTATTGKLTNVVSLTKRGAGTLILDNNAVITDGVGIESGTIQLGNATGRGTLGSGFAGYTASITNNGTLAFNRTSSLDFSNNLSGSGTLSTLSTATGTWNIYGNNTMSGYAILHNGNLPLYFRNAGSIGTPASIQANVLAAVNVRLQIAGGINLPASCPITATLDYGANSTRFSLMSMAGVNSISGSISLAGGGYADPNSRPQINLYAQNAGTELTVNSSVSESDPLGNPYTGDFFLRGNGALGRMYGTINLPAAQLQKVEAVTWTLYSTGNKATVTYISNGRLNMGAANALPVAQLTVVSPGILDLAGFDQEVGPLWGSGLITNSSTTASALLTLTNGGAYTGAIKDSGTTKVAVKLMNPGSPSTQQLLGDCSYSGATTLDIATAIALGDSGLPNSTPIDMGNGSSIDLSTKADHTFALGSAQTLKGDGTVHINGHFINHGTVSLKAAKSGGIVTSSVLTIDNAYSLTYGGTLNLELSGESLTDADTLNLFSATTYGGAFSNILPGTPAPGYAWNTNTLTTDGILRIVAALPTTPTNITCAVVSGGTQLQLSWPNEYTGWTLQGQTNAAGAGLGTDWHDVPGSATTHELLIPIDPGNGSVFFRMIYRP